MLKNFTFLVHEKQNYADNDLSHYFFSEVKGQYYIIIRLQEDQIKRFSSINILGHQNQ